RGAGEVEEDLVVVLAHASQGLAQGHVEHVLPAHQVVQGHPHQEGGLADAAAGHHRSDVSRSQAAPGRALEDAEGTPFTEFLGLHHGVYSSSLSRPVPYFLMSSSLTSPGPGA